MLAASCRKATDASLCGFAIRIGFPSLIASVMCRSLGTKTSGCAADDRDDLVVGDADAAAGTVEDELDVLAREAHQVEGLEAELRVLEREGIEHADHADGRRVVDRRDHLRR